MTTLPIAQLTTQQQIVVLYKAEHENRKNAKSFLRDIGYSGSADELDQALAIAGENPAAVAGAKELGRRRKAIARGIATEVDGHVVEILADLRLRIKDLGLTQTEVASRCGWPQSQVAAYLNGLKEPTLGNLAKLAAAVGCVWRLKPQ